MAKEQPNTHKVLAHPVRQQCLLRIMIEGPTSPNKVAKILDKELNMVAYHIRVLLKYDAIKLVETNARRGASEHVYAAKMDSEAVGLFLAAQFASASRSDLKAFLRTFDEEEKVNPAAAAIPFKADLQGWKEAKKAFHALAKALAAIEGESSKRSGDSASVLKPVSLAFLVIPPDGRGKAA